MAQRRTNHYYFCFWFSFAPLASFAVECLSRPSLIAVRTVIGYGAPHKQGTFHVHGSPLGPD